MKLHRVPGSVALFASLTAASISVGMLVTRPRSIARTAMACNGEYADTLQGLSTRARQIEQGGRASYSYLVRSSAVYECPYFAPDGKLRRKRVEVFEHGTALAYELYGGDTYLLTNHHVAEWPEVTDAGAHKVDGVQSGCKRVDERLRIVSDPKDDDAPGQVVLSKVAVDPPLDAAVLKAAGQKLTVLPYKVGKSAALRQGNAVQVRGFPLGVMQAVNSGKVVNPYDRDQEQGWDHVDFVIDALLSEGNSGSPVLALSCASGEPELVGMFHAGYKEHSALNVVVGIDQLRDLMQKKRRVPRAPAGDLRAEGLQAADRAHLDEALRGPTLPFFDFGGLPTRIERAEGDALLYHVYGRDFPSDERRLLVLEDARDGAGFGRINHLWVRGETGWRGWKVGDLGPDEQDLMARAADGIRSRALRTLELRRGFQAGAPAEDRRRSREVRREMSRSDTVLRDLATSLADLADRIGPTREVPATAEAAPPAPPALASEGPPAPAAGATH